MKKAKKPFLTLTVVFLAFLLLVSCTAASKTEPVQAGAQKAAVPAAAESSGEEIRIRFSFEGGEAVAVLYDNPAAQSLLAQLPADVTVSDYAGAEKIAYFEEALTDEDAPEGYDPQAGDIACYGPWGNLAVFYGDQPYAKGLCPMGRIESGMELLAALPEDASVTVERIEP